MALKRHILAGGLVAALASTFVAAEPEQQPEANALWEQAIVAKGGREKLHAVRNLVVTADFGWTFQRLYVFPSRYWQFSDHRPDVLGVGLVIFDLDRRMAWDENLRINSPEFLDDMTYRLLEGQFLYLLETAWVKPEPVAARRDRVGLTAVDVVETRLPSANIRVDYYLDRQSHLPLRVVIFSTGRTLGRAGFPAKDVPREDRYRLGNYTNVDGLQMPRLANFEGGRSTTSYRFNVAYDERIFTDETTVIGHRERVILDGWEKR